MPTIKDFGAFKITMYFGDHNPPHFHVIGSGYRASVRIADQTVISTKGKPPRRVLRLARRWAVDKRGALEAIWIDYQRE